MGLNAIMPFKIFFNSFPLIIVYETNIDFR